MLVFLQSGCYFVKNTIYFEVFMERCDYVNDNLKLIQETDGLTFGTDALLLAGYINGHHKHGCEFGSGICGAF